MVQINVDNRPHEIIDDIWLGDDGPFEFSPPKVGRLLSAALSGGSKSTTEEAEYRAMIARQEWLRDGFHPDDWSHFMARIEDEQDGLDWGHLIGSENSLMEALLERVSNRPTTSSGGSSASPRRNTGGAAPRPKARTSGNSVPEDSVTS